MKAGVMIHVIDDDAGMRRSLLMLMESASLPMRAYESAEEFMDENDVRLPGCIVLDLRMRGMGGMEMLGRLREAGHEIPVIIISGHADVPTAVRGMKLGAIDVLQKPFEPSALLDAIQRALQQSVEINQRRTSQDEIRRRFAELTARELELLKLVVAGRSNKQIAFDLNISIKTVANHRANLMAKTQALNAADLARLCTIGGIRSPE